MMRFHLCSLSLLGLLEGCSSMPLDRSAHLPFNLAIVPVRTIPMPSTESADGGRHEIELELDPDRVRFDLATALGRECFTRITLLQPPPGVSPAEFQAWSEAKREQFWAESARAAGADLMLQSELRTLPDLKVETNSRCWFNMPLFLLGGPGCYFVDDCTYTGDARLDAWLSDVPANSHRSSGAAVLRVQSRFSRADLDFLDRAGSRPLPYLESFLVPATWLERKGGDVGKSVADKAAGFLAAGVAHEISSESRRILLAQQSSSFHVDAASVLERDGEELHFIGSVILLRGETERIDHWRLEVDGASVDGQCDTGVPDPSQGLSSERWVRFAIEARVHAQRNARFGRLIVVDAGRNPIERSFTFAVREHPSAKDAATAAE